MTAYYSENDPAAAAVLRLFIDEGIIAPGYVDSRSIKEVTADDIRGFTQCHWFAGAGMWSIAARMAGWPDHRPLWTASCPCQPWSGAGLQLGVDDPRHLWPDLYRILGAYRRAGYVVPVLVGEQVAGAAGYHWFDGVRTDLAREEIAARTVDIPACSVDAPHQRNRLYWCAVAYPHQSFIQGLSPAGQLRVDEPHDGVGAGYAHGNGHVALSQEQRRWTGLRESGAQRHGLIHANSDGRDGILADAEGERGRGEFTQRGPQGRTADGGAHAGYCEWFGVCHDPNRCDGNSCVYGNGGPPGYVWSDDDGWCERGQGDVGDALGAGLQGFGGNGDRGRADRRRPDRDSRDGEAPPTHRPVAPADGGGRFQDVADPVGLGWPRRGEPQRPGIKGSPGNIAVGRAVDRIQHRPNGSWWADAEWIICHDGKARRAQPGVRMLVNGMAGRIDLWRLAGNSIVPGLAAQVIGAILDAEEEIANSI